MKTNTTFISGLAIAVVTVAAMGVCETALALDFFPKRSPKPSPAASPAAATAKTTTKAETSGTNLSAKDKEFMKKAAKGGMMEVAMGKVAEQNGQSADVKSFGKRMVADHSKANDELMALAEKKGVKLPSEKPTKEWTSDKDYMDMMVKDHEKDLAEFQNEARNGSDADLKKFAERTAKVVQKHLDIAKQTQGKLQ